MLPLLQLAVDKRGGAPESRAVEKMRIDEEGRSRRSEARMASKMKRTEINEKFDKEITDLMDKLDVDKNGQSRSKSATPSPSF